MTINIEEMLKVSVKTMIQFLKMIDQDATVQVHENGLGIVVTKGDKFYGTIDTGCVDTDIMEMEDMPMNKNKSWEFEFGANDTDIEDGGQARITSFYDDTSHLSLDEDSPGVYFRMVSWDEKKAHEELKEKGIVIKNNTV